MLAVRHFAIMKRLVVICKIRKICVVSIDPKLNQPQKSFQELTFMLRVCIPLVCIELYVSIMTHCKDDYCYKALMRLYAQTQYNVGPTFTFLTHC